MLCIALSPARAAEAAGRPAWRTVPLALSEDYPAESTSEAVLERDFGLLQACGVTRLRVSFGWDDIEPRRHEYAWSATDLLVSVAARHGIRLLPYVCYTPEWAAAGTPGTDKWHTPPHDPSAFGEVMARLAERYRGRIGTWELWNEPDNRDYWTGSVEQYARLLKAGSKGVRRGDPGARVVLGGIAWDLEFLRRLFRDHGAAEHVDIVNLHSYGETWIPEPVETLPVLVARASEILADYGQGEPLWVAEIGYSTLRAPASRPSERTWDYEHTPRYQAVHLAKALALLYASPRVGLVAWYRLHDLPPGIDVIGNEHNRHLGLQDLGGRAKPAWQTFCFLKRLFDPGFRCVDDRLTIGGLIADGVVVHGFELRDGRLVAFAWLPARLPGTVHPDAPDQRTARVQVRLPEGASGPASLLDETGQRVRDLPVGRIEHSAVIELELAAGQVAIVQVQPDKTAPAP